MGDTDTTSDTQPETQSQDQQDPNRDSVAVEIQRLKQGYASRVADERPISHSVAEAYKQVIAARERNKRKLNRP